MYIDKKTSSRQPVPITAYNQKKVVVKKAPPPVKQSGAAIPWLTIGMAAFSFFSKK